MKEEVTSKSRRTALDVFFSSRRGVERELTIRLKIEIRGHAVPDPLADPVFRDTLEPSVFW